MSRLVWLGLAALVCTSCGSCGRGGSAEDRSAPTAVSAPAGARNLTIPEEWAKLGMPAEDLETINPSANQNLFSADYRGCTAQQLMSRVEQALTLAGFTQTCNHFDGLVRGYAKAGDKLLVKVDLIGPVSALSVGNKIGSDPMLYGICFEGFELGPPTRVK